MNGNKHEFFALCLGGFLLLVLFSPIPCAAYDGWAGHRVFMSALPINLASLPMEISFNGNAGQGTETAGTESTPEDGITPISHHPFVRIQNYMLKYVNITTPVSGREIFEASSTGIEGKPAEKISLEVQAGLAELSGALFIVLQL